MLRDSDFKIVYSTGEDEPVEFYTQALLESKQFDLGLGYFSSSGFRALSYSFAYFISQGGKMRIIINNILTPEDKLAIEKGKSTSIQNLVENNIINDVLQLADTLSGKDRHFFNCLSMLIATNKLEIISIIPTGNEVGIVHNKFGIFKDEAGDKVAFTGSPNFSLNALYHNFETISCYKSWTGEKLETERLNKYNGLFQKIWNGQHKSVKIIPLEQVKATISNKFKIEGLDHLLKEEEELLNKFESKNISPQLAKKIKLLHEKAESKLLIEKAPQFTDSIEIRDYQKDAVNNWINNNYKGFFEMATGTGKTFTGLLASVALAERLNSLFILVLVPTKDLAFQWQDETEKFGYKDINIISSDSPSWENTITQRINSLKLGSAKFTVFISTYASFKTSRFQKYLLKLPDQTLLIADEAHNMGSAEMLKKLPDNIKYRLGLSATPHRHFDDSGTYKLLKFFNCAHQATYEFPMSRAIAEKFLCQYKLYPHFAELNNEEFNEYVRLTKEISKRINYLNGKMEDTDSKLERLLRDRRNILNRAEDKLNILGTIVDDLMKNGDVHHTLVYCPEGSSEQDNSSLINKYGRFLGLEKKLRIGKFVGETKTGRRRKLLKDFDNASIQCLLAMKCLDEGVDVKRTETAIFLASSTNPKQYIQRRGRVLRSHPKKSFAFLHDIIALPPDNSNDEKFKEIEKLIFTQEFRRYKEFAEDAVNYVEAMEPIKPILEKYDIEL